MRICVAHETVYRYETPSSGVIQTLRLTPRNHTGQYVVDWRIEISADCRLEPRRTRSAISPMRSRRAARSRSCA